MPDDGSSNEIRQLVEAAIVAGDATTLERLLREHGETIRNQRPSHEDDALLPDYKTGDARAIIASAHHFDTWEQFEAHARALEDPSSPISRFEAAVDAVVNGDVPTLQRLLHHDAELIRARSAREHRSMLLHYVGVNGVEAFRQRTPKNAVQVVEVLLAAGADVDAVADMYRGTTTLGLVATSVHPVNAGVQGALIDVLLNHGASFGQAVAPDYTNGQLINACLANGRADAAEFLVSRGAPLDLEGAAGVGHLDVVKSFFDAGGGLKPTATMAQMRSGFSRACGYGRASVVEFLLDRGVDVEAPLPPEGIFQGHTALHVAALGGHVDTAKALLKRNAPVDATDGTFGTTPICWALYGWANEREGAPPDRHHQVVAVLVAAGGTVEPAWLANEAIRSDPKMLEALSRRFHSDRMR